MEASIREAKIVIEEVELSLGQSMTVRVAIGSMIMQLNDPEYRRALGPIGDGYLARLLEIQTLIFKGVK